jgi:hypothetical protein
MRTIASIVLGAFLITTSFSPARAQVNVKKLGQATMAFLEVSISPKAAAMGDAYSAMSRGAESMFYNPAGLASMDSQVDIMLTRTQWFADINYSGGAGSVNISNIGSFGVSVLAVDYGEIQGTELLSQTDPQGYRETGSVSSVGAHAIGLGYARQISSNFAMGGQVQYASQRLGENPTLGTTNHVSTLTYNFGMNFNTGWRTVGFSMAIRNFSPSVRYEEVTAELPLTFKAGVSADMLNLISGEQPSHSSFIVSSEFSHPNNYTERIMVGGEYRFMELLSLRGGYQFNHDVSGLNGGVGITQQIADTKLGLDYSYSDIDTFSGVHRLALSASF